MDVGGTKSDKLYLSLFVLSISELICYKFNQGAG